MDIFNNLCRACNIEKQQMINIHNTENLCVTISIKEMLEYCLQTTIAEENKYPQRICYDCVKQLEISYRFLKRFILAQREFEEVYTRLEEDNEHHCMNEEDNVDETIGEVFEENLIQVYKDSNNDTQHEPFIDVKDKSDDNNLLRSIKKTIGIKSATDTSNNNPAILSIAPSPDNIPAIICALCNKTFYTTKALNLHLKLSHKRKF